VPKRGDYQVGFGKPPKHSQFQRGKSGNPAGRPKKKTGPRPLDHIVHDVLMQMVTLNMGGKKKVVTMLEAILIKLALHAMNGNGTAAKQLFALMDILAR
jgi:Family of unknown function (DUF5681)